MRPRHQPDGLPFRVYARVGKEKFSIGFKSENGTWLFRLSCPVHDEVQIAELRKEASLRAISMLTAKPTELIDDLISDWFSWQYALPLTSIRRRADSTLKENESEAKRLRVVFGHMPVRDFQRVDAYEYLDLAEQQNRPSKGNKEMSLLQLILERAVRKGMIAANPLIDLEKLPTVANQKYVSDDDLSLAREVGKRLGPSQQIVALALQTAYLCVRRSVEVRDLTRDGLTDEGIVWVSGKTAKRNAKLQVLIEWSPDLRAVIDEALAVDRGRELTGPFIFGTLRGERCTKGGWKSVLKVLMDACAAEAEARGVAFERFSLQDLRPKGVSDKLEDGAEDVLDATLHTSERMVRQVYDRRRTRSAKPVR